jgi:hypothetical protein
VLSRTDRNAEAVDARSDARAVRAALND